MSITSRQRSAKHPNPQCRETHAAQPYIHPIRQRVFDLWRPDKGDSHNYKPHGKFGGCTIAQRAKNGFAKLAKA